MTPLSTILLTTNQRADRNNPLQKDSRDSEILFARALVGDELINIQKKEIHNLDFNDVSVKLIEATDKVLPMMPENLRKKTVDVLRSKGVEVMLNTQVVGYDGDILRLKNGVEIPTTTVIWAAGVRAVDFIANCGGEYARDGRIWIDEDLMVKGAVNKNVFAIGDCAGFMHGDMQRPLPTVAPVATQQAKIAFENIMSLIKGASKDSLKKFVYKDLGAMATIGRGQAVVGSGLPGFLKPFFSSGFLAWCAWMFIHLIRLAGAHSNFTVAIKWTWNLISGTRLGRIITNIRLEDDMTAEEIHILTREITYQIYAELQEYEPKIWRRFQVMNDITVAKLAYDFRDTFQKHQFNKTIVLIKPSYE